MSECMYIYIHLCIYIYITLLNEHYNNSCDDHDHDSITMFTASVHNIQYVCIYIRNACMDIKILLLRNVKLNRPKSPHKIKNKTMFFEYIIYSLSAVF